MTVSSNINIVSHSGDGVNKIFPYTFKIALAADAVVIHIDASNNRTELSPSLYSITGIGSAGGGDVTYPLSGAAIAAGERLVIFRRVPFTQEVDLINQTAYYPDVLEDALDKLTYGLQQLENVTSRALVTVEGDEFAGNIPAKAALANKTIAFDGSGEPVVGPSITDIANAGTNAAAAASSAASAASSASNASTSATNAATSATNASNSASAASASETNAASSASAASTSASNAGTSETNAAASASAASTSASNAATSETNAASSASAAASSASSASASASSAAASWDSFDDIYLGSKASDPTLDNDGDPLTEGRLYWNSTTKKMRTYTGAAWVDSYNGYLGIDDNASATVITLDNAGKTGIGGTPASFFHVNSGAADEVGRFESTGTPYLSLYDTGVRQGYWYAEGTRIELAAEAGNDLSLLTAGVSRMFIESATGSVGVGDTSPESHYGNPYRFLARHDQNAPTRMGITNAVSGASAEVLFGMIGGTANSFMNQKLVDNSGAPYFQFDIGSGVDHLQFSTSGAEKIRLTQAGNFGIGVTPAAKLHVNGAFRQSGATAPFEWTVNSAGTDYYSLSSPGYANNILVANAAGYVGIGNSSPADIFEIGDFSATGATAGRLYQDSGRYVNSSTTTTGTAAHNQFYSPNGLIGSIQTNGSSTAYNTTSDYRLKVTFGQITDATALDKVMALPIYDLAFKQNPLSISGDNTVDPDSRQISALAHEIQALFPWAVTGEKDAVDEDGDPIWQMADPSKLVYVAFAAIQELKRENDALRSRIEALETV